MSPNRQRRANWPPRRLHAMVAQCGLRMACPSLAGIGCTLARTGFNALESTLNAGPHTCSHRTLAQHTTQRCERLQRFFRAMLQPMLQRCYFLLQLSLSRSGEIRRESSRNLASPLAPILTHLANITSLFALPHHHHPVSGGSSARNSFASAATAKIASLDHSLFLIPAYSSRRKFTMQFSPQPVTRHPSTFVTLFVRLAQAFVSVFVSVVVVASLFKLFTAQIHTNSLWLRIAAVRKLIAST